MSQENVEVARGFFDTFNRKGVRGLARDSWHPDVIWEVPPEWGILAGGECVWCGAERAMTGLEDLEGQLGRIHVEVDEAIDAGDEVVMMARASGEGAQSGAAVDATLHYAVQVEDGRIRRVRVFSERREALEAVGL